MLEREADKAARILVVEDESSILTALSLLLDMEGHRVAEATNGRQGLERLAAFVPDLVVTDYMMPYMDGIEMIREIRRDPAYAELPIVLISAALPPKDEVADLGVLMLSKPVNIDRLLAIIGDLLRRRPAR